MSEVFQRISNLAITEIDELEGTQKKCFSRNPLKVEGQVRKFDSIRVEKICPGL